MPMQAPRNVAPPEAPKRNAVAPAQPVSPANIESFLHDDDAMKTPTWWVQTPSQLDATLSHEGPLRLPNPNFGMSMEQSDKMPVSDRIMRIRPVSKRSRGMGRRRAIATIAAGGVVAAGALVVGKLNLLHLGGTQTPVVQQGGTITQQAPPQQTGNGGNKPTGNNGNKPAGGTGNGGAGTTGQKGNVVGNTALAKDSAMTFANPANGKSSILIHLPDGNFVAYDRACTHVGVLVNYDPATNKLVCPAHGSVFDPTKNAAVLQGPATLPLKPVTIHVNGDGTIVAM
jgi:Rieske Fe-S protein